MDYRGKHVKGAAVVWLGAQGPQGIEFDKLTRITQLVYRPA